MRNIEHIVHLISLKFNSLIISLLIIVCCIQAIYAHPGKTDGNGGHYNSNTGEYHYHHGHEAHFHIDGKCPFEFDDKTGQSSGALSNSGSSGPSSNWETTSQTTSNLTQNKSNKTKSDSKFNFTTFAIIFLIVISIIEYLTGKYQKAKNPHPNQPQQRR